jgi:DNA-binding transcriptional regulator YhcF (GntR family)
MDARLPISVDPKSDLPPSEQLAQQVRFAVAAGQLTPGDRLPSVRALAVDALVNPNTVGKAWRDLAREGVLESRLGDGVFVAAEAREICVAARDAVLRERIERLVADALSAGLSRGGIEELVDAALGRTRAWKRAGGLR